MSEERAIKISIAGREYPLTVPAADVERIEAIADTINKRVQSFQESYAVRDKQDLLAMATLQLLVEKSAPKPTPDTSGPVLAELRDWIKSEVEPSVQ